MDVLIVEGDRTRGSSPFMDLGFGGGPGLGLGVEKHRVLSQRGEVSSPPPIRRPPPKASPKRPRNAKMQKSVTGQGA